MKEPGIERKHQSPDLLHGLAVRSLSGTILDSLAKLSPHDWTWRQFWQEIPKEAPDRQHG